MATITPEEIRIISKYIHTLTGIVIEEKKAYLIESRLGGLLKREGCTSYTELCHKAKADVTRSLEKTIIDGITTNETLFFRDVSPFELLKGKILPDLMKRCTAQPRSPSKMSIRIWCAGCSTGQEVYSIAIVLKEILADPNGFDIRLLGTDLSDAAIAQARTAQYSKFEIERGLPTDRLLKYFDPVGGSWRVKEEIRRMGAFRKLNLMGPFSDLGKFDIVFCRNVAIYFKVEDRKALFSKIADILTPDGYLIIGSTESMTGLGSRFQPKRYMRSIYYQLGF